MSSPLEKVQQLLKKSKYAEIIEKIKSSPVFKLLTSKKINSGEYKLTDEQKQILEARKNKKKFAWALMLNHSQKYIQGVVEGTMKNQRPVLSMVNKQGEKLNLIDLREESDYCFLVRDLRPSDLDGSIEEIKEKIVNNKEIKQGHYFSGSLVDKNIGTYRSTKLSRNFFQTACVILRVHPKLIVRGFPEDIYSSVSGDTVSESSKKYLQIVEDTAKPHLFKEQLIREFVEENKFPSMDTQSIQDLAVQLGISPKMKMLYQSGNTVTSENVELFPDLSPDAVLGNPHLRAEDYNEVLVRSSKDIEIVGILFNETALEPIQRAFGGDEESLFSKMLKAVQQSGLPTFLVRTEIDRKYKVPYQPKLEALAEDLLKNQKEIEELRNMQGGSMQSQDFQPVQHQYHEYQQYTAALEEGRKKIFEELAAMEQELAPPKSPKKNGFIVKT